MSEPARCVELRNAVVQATQITTGGLPAVPAHDGQLVRVFQDLIVNAIQHRGDQPVRIHITAEPLEHEWLVKVKDNGIGIAPQYHDYIFGLFSVCIAGMFPVPV